MIKKFFVLIFIGFISSVYSQENLFTFENTLKESTIKINEIFNIVDKSTDKISLSLLDTRNIYSYLFDDSYNKIGEIKSKNLPMSFKELLGSSINKEAYNYYFSNYKKTKFGVYTLDFQKGTAISEKVGLNFEKEHYIESFTIDNTFYLLSVEHNSSKLNIYKFNSSSFEKKALDFSEYQFINKKNQKTNLYNIIKSSKPSKIIEGNSSSIIEAFNEFKIYIDNNNLQISIDDLFYTTQIITIDLSTNNFNYEKIKTPFINAGVSTFKKSNSFLNEGLLFQISSSAKEARFKISELSTKKILKKYTFPISKTITFDPKFIETKKSKRKTKSFLSRMTIHHMGASVSFSKDSYNIEIGSYTPAGNSSGVAPGFGNFSSFNFYNSNDIYSKTINGDFDKNFNYIEVEKDIKVNNLNNYFRKYKDKIEAKTIFKYKEGSVLGFLIKDSRHLRFMKFAD